MPISKPLELHPLQRGRDRTGQRGNRHVEHRDLDMLPAACLPAMDQRGQNPAHHVTAGAHVDKRRRRFHRMVRKSGDTYESRRRLDRIVHRAELRVAAVRAVALARRINQPRKTIRNLIVAEAERLHHAVEIILDQHVGVLEQLQHDFLPARLLQIDRDRALVGIEHQERVSGAARRQLRPAQHFARDWRLDLDNIRAHRGQLQRAIRRRVNLSEVDHANVIQRQTHRWDLIAKANARSPSDAPRSVLRQFGGCAPRDTIARSEIPC